MSVTKAYRFHHSQDLQSEGLKKDSNRRTVPVFVYNGDEIKIEVCAIKGHDIVLELRVEHLRSRYFINDKILIDN